MLHDSCLALMRPHKQVEEAMKAHEGCRVHGKLQTAKARHHKWKRVEQKRQCSEESCMPTTRAPCRWQGTSTSG